MGPECVGGTDRSGTLGRMTRAIKVRHVLAVLVTTLVLAPPSARADAGPALGPFALAPTPTWTGTWEGAPSGTVPALPGATVRNVVHTSVGGSAARIRIS